jgi:hypothetical protein
LARGFRYYGKKRGHRRTGSPLLGSAGEAVFWAVFLLLGCGGTVLMVLHFIVPEWRVHHEFVQTSCKVLDKRIGETQDGDGTLYRPELRIEYEAGGVTYRDWHYDIHGIYTSGRENAQAVLDRFDLHGEAKKNLYPCWYDPTNPDVAVLVREYRLWIWWAFAAPISFIAIGAGGLIYTILHWGKSAEHRAAASRRIQEQDLFGAGIGRRSFPFVPQGVDMTNSPGTRLRFRLPMSTSHGWMLFGTLMFCVIWNGVVAVFAAIAVRNHIAGRPDWFLSLFIIPFALVGLGSIVFFIRQFLIATGVGPTLIELSDHPLEPGGTYRAFLSQFGRLTINALRVRLICKEEATYRQGTNTRTETREVFRQELFCRDGFQIQSGLPFEEEFDFIVPDGAMHSFKAKHNEINWTLAVEGDLAGWPNYCRTFPVIVRPIPGDIDP